MTPQVRRILGEIDRLPRADLALCLTLVALLLRPVGDPWIRPVLTLGCAVGLLFATARRSVWLWAALLALASWRVATAWPLGDNHAYLLCYWLLAALLTRGTSDGDAGLAWNGRVLIGLVFAFATLWKAVLSPDYLDGGFFLIALVDDRRFEHWTRLLAGIGSDELDLLRAVVRTHADGLGFSFGDAPIPDGRLVATARGLTLGLVAFEAAIAVAFLVPRLRCVARVRDPLLLLFCAAVYPMAPVEGFAWLLLSMGVAQCEPGRIGTRRAYLAVFALVLLATRWPWLPLLTRI